MCPYKCSYRRKNQWLSGNMPSVATNQRFGGSLYWISMELLKKSEGLNWSTNRHSCETGAIERGFTPLDTHIAVCISH